MDEDHYTFGYLLDIFYPTYDEMVPRGENGQIRSKPKQGQESTFDSTRGPGFILIGKLTQANTLSLVW